MDKKKLSKKQNHMVTGGMNNGINLPPGKPRFDPEEISKWKFPTGEYVENVPCIFCGGTMHVEGDHGRTRGPDIRSVFRCDNCKSWRVVKGFGEDKWVKQTPHLSPRFLPW